MSISIPQERFTPLRSEAHPQEKVGDAIARTLADIGVTTAFGVISIHNMPILDAIARQGRIGFVPARGEAGAMNMADAYARVSQSFGICVTSTGTAAGNAAGSQVEALTAGSPVLHITTQVDREFVDRDRAAIHDVPRQPDMLKAISKAYLRIWEPAAAIDTLLMAVRQMMTAPSGPVTLEIPVDVQRSNIPKRDLCGMPVVSAAIPAASQLDELAARICGPSVRCFGSAADHAPRPRLHLISSIAALVRLRARTGAQSYQSTIAALSVRSI